MIYYVEDDIKIRDLALYALAQAGFEAKGFADADSFFFACEDETPDAVLLDIMLPGKDGLQILKEIREHPTMKHVPVMMLSAKGTEIDKVSGLDAGADDYLAKPYGLMELVSRVRAMLRRAQSPAYDRAAHLVAGAIELDGDTRTVEVNHKPVALTLKEFELLRALMASKDHVLTRAQLLEDVWGWDFVGNTRTVDVHIQTLRQKIAAIDPQAAEAIDTVRGVGYTIRSRG